MNNLSEVAYIQLFEVYNLVTYGPRMVVAMKARQQSLGKTVLKFAAGLLQLHWLFAGREHYLLPLDPSMCHVEEAPLK